MNRFVVPEPAPDTVRGRLRNTGTRNVMLRNYIIIALRNMRRQFGFTAINIVGLSIGLACCILIVLFVRDELSYDRHFEHADRIYRIAIDGKIGEQEVMAPQSPGPMAALLMETFPEVESAVRLFRPALSGSGEISIRLGDTAFLEKKLYYADSTFFEVFSHSMVVGDPAKALTEPNSVVLTESTARKYFGDENGIGQTLRFDDQTDYQVTGIIRDAPQQTHFRFDLLASLNSIPFNNDMPWLNNPFNTYVRFRDDYCVEAFETKLNDYVERNVGPNIQAVFGMNMQEFAASGGRYRYFTQPLTSIHLHSNLNYELEPNSDIRYVYTFSVVALLILMIACFNFMNLSTARSARRALEVGIRKVLGSDRRQLAIQFLVEVLVLCALAMILALLMVEAVLPAFNLLVEKEIETVYLGSGYLPLIVSFVLVIGVLAGAYPAFVLTRFEIIKVLKGKLLAAGSSSRLRSGLVVLQFSITIALMIGTAVVYNQMEYTQTRRLGFDQESVLVIERAAALGGQRDAFKNDLTGLSGVLSAAGLDNLPGGTFGDDSFRPVGSSADDLKLVWMIYADHDVIETLGMNVVAGRDFSRAAPRDSAVLIVNQTAAASFGWDNPVGQKVASPFARPNQPDRIYDIVGMLEDFHFESLREEIRPIAIELVDNYAHTYMAVRLRPERVNETLTEIEALWGDFVPGESFNYSFLDSNLDALYRSDRQTGQLIGVFAGLAILIACLGLFGLAAYMAEKRIKEVGIRKVMGASTAGIVGLFAKEFVWLVGIAFVIAAPLAYLAVSRWLEGFVYRIDIEASVFISAGAVALLIALLSVGYQSIRAALSNPVDALRGE